MSIASAEVVPMSKPFPKVLDLQLNGLTKRYGGTTVVENLTLEVPRGDFFGLIGANGAGKSTTLKMLAGMLEQSGGSAHVLGTAIEDLQPQHLARIGYVPETHRIYHWMTVGEAVWFCKRFNQNWNDGVCESLLSLFHLERSKKTKALSKGMLAKLGLVLALSHDPELLILDEPMSGLDPIAREEFLDGVLRTVSERNCTVVLSSHSIDDVQRMSDSIGLLHEGRLLMHRPTEQILSQTKRILCVVEHGREPPKLQSTIWAKNEERQWSITVSNYSPRLLDQLNHASDVTHVEVQDLSLEDVYKDYVRGQA